MKYANPLKISRGRKPLKTPYWNIYRAIIAGWFIYHPGKMLRGIAILLFLLWVAPITWKILIIASVGLIIYLKARNRR